MQKEEIIRKTAKKNYFSIGETAKITDALLDQIKYEVAKGEKVTFMNFGTFERAWHKDRLGINPQTKERLLIPAHFSINFRSGKAFRNDVANSKKKE